MFFTNLLQLNNLFKVENQKIISFRRNGSTLHLALLASTIFLLFGFTGFSQTQTEFRIDPNYDKLQTLANEVYQDCPEYASQEHLKIYKEQVIKVVIMQVADLSDQYDLTDLSTVGLKNKCNLSLQHDTSVDFNPNTFNPLKYFFDFYASEDKSYHVSGTNYIITITK